MARQPPIALAARSGPLPAGVGLQRLPELTGQEVAAFGRDDEPSPQRPTPLDTQVHLHREDRIDYAPDWGDTTVRIAEHISELGHVSQPLSHGHQPSGAASVFDGELGTVRRLSHSGFEDPP